MLTPSQISIKPNVIPLIVPDYDFDGQNRWDGTLMAGNQTSNSIQTFDGNGKPKDAKDDKND
jgi:hypothetical protein